MLCGVRRNVIKLYGAGTGKTGSRKFRFLVLEFLERGTLAQRIAGVDAGGISKILANTKK